MSIALYRGEVERTLDDYADLVRADLGRAVEGLIAAGRHLAEAKAEHPGSFVAWLESGACGVGRSRCYQLMKIADGVGDFQHVGNLPSDSVALEALARLGGDRVAELIEAGDITPDTTRKQAVELVRAELPSKPRAPKAEHETRDADPETGEIGPVQNSFTEAIKAIAFAPRDAVVEDLSLDVITVAINRLLALVPVENQRKAILNAGY